MDVKMPKLGESVHEGTIEQWLISVGDYVDEYEPLCEVVTDKVTAEVPSTVSGTITEILVSEGETVQIDHVICKIESSESNQSTNTHNNKQETDDNKNETTVNTNNMDVLTDKTPKSDSSVHTDQNVRQNEQSNTESAPSPLNNGRYSPVVFKIASENNVDLSRVRGTGFEGRVTKKDIEAYVHSEKQNSKLNNKTEPSFENQVASTDSNHTQPGQSIPVKGVRKAIAQNMVTSVTEIPHGWMMVEVDATNLVKTRNHHKNTFKENEGYNLTFFAFFVKAVAEALKSNPLLNSSWDGEEIIIHKDINISIAVADEDKLYVPVIKHADEKSIKGIAREINELARKARNKQLTQEDMSGGTFTVNNTGTFGSVSSMGIINHPQAAILQVESIVKKPVVIDDMIAIRSMVNLCISIDHRILDGVQTGRFMSQVKQRIEQFTVENTSIY
ncbi:MULTISPECIES: dihydrolipoamide acetyltransferase family protein [unclassified Staphylococcus]|uniref:dihydrolipoamide acetyltransferase family protein n=1 Tax=unclassified Staphylococcus TaxID=91994 RepID=UPI00187E8686|nr:MULTISPECIES: dihydrolipoamide acetyltransferase family protein [unclassified Staphylococcus]MBF2757178.1 2-oxo acid dehydrogenase subunit E2 [Staphylococcus haemolyticus]MBF2772593.1 2-oxo acid dehydrogenase subunit E2 [Staphylococcus haemolyticus]MBF2776668.1 2-oxo acid dehydrogenase subunit E2 [Staphylococcus haemolyticus]MBF2816318.1 2-oxo acid dehydrogenase subunit E2 [Staphylococcus haemolyticus]MBF9720475.1 2-oxo acid dehydrogenase subunit E2 [Staphylococcus haemolyticus]